MTATEVVRVVVAWATADEENASMVAAVGVGASVTRPGSRYLSRSCEHGIKIERLMESH